MPEGSLGSPAVACAEQPDDRRLKRGQIQTVRLKPKGEAKDGAGPVQHL